MTYQMRMASTVGAIVGLLWLAPAPNAYAQDVMQLDLAFRNSLSQGHAPEVEQETRRPQGRRHKARNAHRPVAEEKHRARL